VKFLPVASKKWTDNKDSELIIFLKGDIKLQTYNIIEGILHIYCGVAPRGRSIERPLLINGYAYLAVSLPDNGPVYSNS
jgi:hypothetical protein